MNAKDRISKHFHDSQQALQAAERDLGALIAKTANAMTQTLSAGGKLLICGNGGSASDAMHFSSELVNKMEMQRAPLAAIALNADTSAITSIANDFAFEFVYSKQVQALGKTEDMLVVFTSSGNSDNINRAINAAHDINMQVVALSGNSGNSSGGKTAALIKPQDIELRVNDIKTTRIQEMHGLIIHCLCDLIDQQLFGDLS